MCCLHLFSLKNELILRICHYFMYWVGFSGFTITQTILKDIKQKKQPENICICINRRKIFKIFL